MSKKYIQAKRQNQNRIQSQNQDPTVIVSRRLPAESEESRYIQFTLPHADTDWANDLDAALAVFVNCASVIAESGQEVILVCKSIASAQALFPKSLFPKFIFIEADSNDSWVRDHGGITIIENEKKVILDFQFNGWGQKYPYQKDNLITQKVYDSFLKKEGYVLERVQFKMSLSLSPPLNPLKREEPPAQHFESHFLENTDFVLEGGSIESNGAGTLLTTTTCLLHPKRNPHLNKKEIESHLKHIFGLKQVLWLENAWLEGDDTDGHIDMLARFADENTILYVKCDNPNDKHFKSMQAMEAELQAFRNTDNEPFKLIPLPWPDAIYDEEENRLPASYANFLITNHLVLVPQYRLPQDEDALQVIQACFPRRKAVGIDALPLIRQHGAVHCVSMQVY